MKSHLILALFLLSFVCCGNKAQTDQNPEPAKSDTIISKVYPDFTELDSIHEVKIIRYFRLADNDTLDFNLRISQGKDSTVSIYLLHENTMQFAEAIKLFDECLSTIQEDFDLSKTDGLALKTPVYYPDLANKLATEYNEKHGTKKLKYGDFVNFLMTSSLTATLNEFFNAFNVEVKRYNIEKFHFVEKENYEKYFSDISPDILKDYPEMIFDGLNYLSVELKTKE